MTTRYIYSFTEPINPEQLIKLFKQTGWANKRNPLDVQQSWIAAISRWASGTTIN